VEVGGGKTVTEAFCGNDEDDSFIGDDEHSRRREHQGSRQGDRG